MTSNKGVEVDGVLLPDGKHVIGNHLYTVNGSNVVVRGAVRGPVEWALVVLAVGFVTVAVIRAISMFGAP